MNQARRGNEPVTTAAVVQARMTSSRLPGKVLTEVAGKSLLEYLLDRLAHAASLDKVVVATSDDPTDDAVVDLCERLSVASFRGSLDDVAGRLLGAVETHEIDVFVRVCADSPLLDPALVDLAVKAYRSEDCDLVSNVVRRTFPTGQSVEVTSRGCLESARHAMTRPDQREHVTRVFYEQPADFLIHSLERADDVSDVAMSVDGPGDLARFAAMVDAFDRPHWTYGLEELLTIYAQLS